MPASLSMQRPSNAWPGRPGTFSAVVLTGLACSIWLVCGPSVSVAEEEPQDGEQISLEQSLPAAVGGDTDGLLFDSLLIDTSGTVCPPLYVTDPDGSLPLMDPVFAEPTYPWHSGGCSDCGGSHGCNSCSPRWFASASGLVMTRTLPDGVAMSTGPGGVALTSADAAANWPGGLDLRIGRWFGPQQRHGVEGIYWGVFNIGSAATASGGGLDGIPAVAPSIIVGSTTASSLFENASQQRAGRNDLVNNVEVNWLYSTGKHPELLDEQQRWSLVWLAGFRFFQLLDTLTLTSPSAASDPLILDVTANNNLFGGQVGTRLDWRFARRFRLAAIPKFMIGGSSVSNLSTLQTANGTYATYADGNTVSSRVTGSTFAYLGSVDGLVAWDITDHWSLWIGYRVVGVGNVIDADSVWPTTITGPSSLALIDTTGSTVVHGGFAGFESRY